MSRVDVVNENVHSDTQEFADTELVKTYLSTSVRIHRVAYSEFDYQKLLLDSREGEVQMRLESGVDVLDDLVGGNHGS